jgi:hypothetical protein
MPICHLPNRDRRWSDVTTLKSAWHPWTTFFSEDSASNKLTAATLPASGDRRLFPSRTGALRPWIAF